MSRMRPVSVWHPDDHWSTAQGPIFGTPGVVSPHAAGWMAAVVKPTDPTPTSTYRQLITMGHGDYATGILYRLTISSTYGEHNFVIRNAGTSVSYLLSGMPSWTPGSTILAIVCAWGWIGGASWCGMYVNGEETELDFDLGPFPPMDDPTDTVDYDNDGHQMDLGAIGSTPISRAMARVYSSALYREAGG
ncbi:MAG: hypothetical protein ACOC00_00105 [Halothiobacillaceae bacterium]